MKAVIMAAGKSTRTYPLTLTRPKPLLKILNTTLLERHLASLAGLVDGALIIVGYKGEMIREAFGGAFHDLPIEYVEQTEQRGTGHAVLQCAGRITEPFLVLNGDDLYDPRDLARIAGADQAALVKRVENPEAFGIYEVRDGDRVVRLVEKPTEIFSNIANIGVYRFTPDVFDALARTQPSERGEIELTSAVQTLAEHGDFRVVRAQGYWQSIAYPWHLLDAGEYFMEQELTHDIQGAVSPAAHLSGKVYIGKGSEIRPGVVIEGPVCIGEDCVVGPNCWIRPGTTLGRGCRVGHATEIKNSILMDGVKVPHLSYVGDSVIGERANLGCGTVTANVRHDGKNVKSLVNRKAVDSGRRKFGAIIGDNVHTGINTSIYPGRKIWPGKGTLPGQVVARDIDE